MAHVVIMGSLGQYKLNKNKKQNIISLHYNTFESIVSINNTLDSVSNTNNTTFFFKYSNMQYYENPWCATGTLAVPDILS